MNKPSYPLLAALSVASWVIFCILILAMFDPHALAAFWRSLNVFGGEP